MVSLEVFFDSRDHADSRARTMTSMPLNYGSVRETPAIHDADFEDVPRYPSLSTHESKATPGTPQTAANFFRPRIRFAKQFLGSSGCHNHRIPKLSFLAVLRVGWGGGGKIYCSSSRCQTKERSYLQPASADCALRAFSDWEVKFRKWPGLQLRKRPELYFLKWPRLQWLQ